MNGSISAKGRDDFITLLNGFRGQLHRVARIIGGGPRYIVVALDQTPQAVYDIPGVSAISMWIKYEFGFSIHASLSSTVQHFFNEEAVVAGRHSQGVVSRTIGYG
jgi:hypothetical protein